MGPKGHFHLIGRNYAIEYWFRHSFSLDYEAQILHISVIRGLILGWIFLSDYFTVFISCCNRYSAFSSGLTNIWGPGGVLLFTKALSIKATT